MTPTRETLLALADRVEALTGPDREVDFLIWAATSGVAEISWPTEGHPMTPGKGGRVEGYGPDGEWNLYGFIDPQSSERNWQPYGGEDRYPRFTRSLDAAMTLVPEGRGWLAGYGRIRPDEPLGGAMITRIAAPTSFAPDAHPASGRCLGLA